MAVLSLDDVKRHLNIVENDKNTELEATLAAAVAVVEAQVGPLEPRAVTSYVASRYGLGCVLPSWPVVSLTSATVDTNTVDVDGLRVDESGVVYGLPSGSAVVTYQVGRNPVPADIVQALKETVRHLWVTQRGAARRPGSPDEVTPGSAYSLPIRVMQLLAPHRVPRVA